jgi:hypothetical protein
VAMRWNLKPLKISRRSCLPSDFAFFVPLSPLV